MYVATIYENYETNQYTVAMINKNKGANYNMTTLYVNDKKKKLKSTTWL